jgi:hypothetical protein
MACNFETLRQQRDELYEDARNHSDSEADQMVQILLLGALRNQQAGDYVAELDDALARERRGYRQARAKRIEESQRTGVPEAAETNRPGSSVAGSEASGRGAGWDETSGPEIDENRIELADAEMRPRKVAQALESAKAAAESSKEVTPMEIYNKIAQVIGLRPPRSQEANAAGDGFGL